MLGSPIGLLSAEEVTEAVRDLRVDVRALTPMAGQLWGVEAFAGQDDQGRIAWQRQPRPDQRQFDPGLDPKRIEIVEIGDARQQRHGNFNHTTLGRRAKMSQGHRIFSRKK